MLPNILITHFILFKISSNGLNVILIYWIMFTAKDYGLFLADEDVKKGVWLEPGRNLDYYILRNGVSYISSWNT